MPNYDYRCSKCKTAFEEFHLMADRNFPTKNPCPECGATGCVEIAFVTPPAAVDPVRLGVTKPDNGFREVMHKIHENTYGSNLDKSKHF